MIDALIDFIATIWGADRAMRESGRMGESELEKKSGHYVAWICGGVIFLLWLAGLVWWFLVG